MSHFPTRPRAPFVLFLILFLAAGCDRRAVESVETSGPVEVGVDIARLDTLRTSIAVTGTVTPAPGADWTITAPAPGRITELPKHEGDAVRDGDLLVRFDVPSLAADLAARQSEVAQTTARLQSARSAAARLAGLVDRGIAAQRELDEARRDQAEAEAGVSQAASARAAAEVLAGRAVVNARFAGVVARRWHSAGDLVDGGIGDPVLRVIDPSRLEIVADVPVTDLARVQPGRAASITSPTDGGAIAGRVLTKPAVVDPGAATGAVRVSLPRGARLTAGTPVQLGIVTDERPQVLVIPDAAVMRDGEDTYVLLAGTDQKAHRAPVTIGLVTRELTQILSGIAAGDRVILAGGAPLPDGAAITIKK